MRTLMALLIALLVQSPAWAGGSAWTFSTRLSSAGPICVASMERGGIATGFYGLPFGPTYAFVKGVNLPANARSTWQVSGYEWRQFTGIADRYNGFHFYPGIPSHFLREVARGSRLDLYLHDRRLAGNAPLIGTRNISLSGSAHAISSLLECQAGQYFAAYRALVVVEAFWYVPVRQARSY